MKRGRELANINENEVGTFFKNIYFCSRLFYITRYFCYFVNRHRRIYVYKYTLTSYNDKGEQIQLKLWESKYIAFSIAFHLFNI